MLEDMNKDRMRSPEEAGIEIRQAVEGDVVPIEAFLSRPEIDSLFVPALSGPARGITIRERAEKKFREGAWIISAHEGKVVGCMALVNSKLTNDVPPAYPEKGMPLSEGVSLADWKVDKLIELSTVVTDRELRDKLHVKGVGAALLNQAKEWVRSHGDGKWGFLTDSWVGGDMGGFVDTMNAKAYASWLQMNGRKVDELSGFVDTIVRIYSDPGKRGIDGPPTVVYGIPIEDRDWEFFLKHQDQIRDVKKLYERLEREQ
jgi:GNAT superfamily N-acetyltransferase